MTLRLVPVDSGKTIKLDKPVLLVGRNPDCDVILDDSRKVSRLHCLLACVEKRVFIRDLGSTNGVWVNGHRVEREARMRVGDEVSFADLKYELVVVDEEAERPRPSARPDSEHDRRTGDRDRRRTPDNRRRDPEDYEDEMAVKQAPVVELDIDDAPAFDERETRDRRPPLVPAKITKERLVALPDEDDSFVVEPSMMSVPKPLPFKRGTASEDELPLLDDDAVIPLSKLLEEDDDEPTPRKK